MTNTTHPLGDCNIYAECINKPGRATDTPSAYELRAIQALNSDRNRRFAEIDRGPAAGRSQMVHEALSQCPSRFDLCRKSSRIFRLIHDKSTDRFATTITKALKWISQPADNPMAPPAAERKFPQPTPAPETRQTDFAMGAD